MTRSHARSHEITDKDFDPRREQQITVNGRIVGAYVPKRKAAEQASARGELRQRDAPLQKRAENGFTGLPQLSQKTILELGARHKAHESFYGAIRAYYAQFVERLEAAEEEIPAPDAAVLYEAVLTQFGREHSPRVLLRAPAERFNNLPEFAELRQLQAEAAGIEAQEAAKTKMHTRRTPDERNAGSRNADPHLNDVVDETREEHG